jgi:hypothetical protein
MQPDRDAYAVLGIPPSASMWAIHKAYLGLRLRYHFGDSRRTGITNMREIEAAYQALATPKRRTAYERSRFAPETPAPASTGRARPRPALRALGCVAGVMIGSLLGWLVGAGIGVLSGEWVDAAPGLQAALAIAVSLVVVTIGPDALIGGVGLSPLWSLLINGKRSPPTPAQEAQVVGWGAAVGESVAGALTATGLLRGWWAVAAVGIAMAGGCALGVAAVRVLRGVAARGRGEDTHHHAR